MYSVVRLGSLMSTNLVAHHRRVLEGVAGRLGLDARWVEAASLHDVDLAFSCGLPISVRPEEWTVAVAPVAADPGYGGRPVYFTTFVVRHDHPARTFEDLAGSHLLMNEPVSHSGYAAVLDHLADRCLDLGFFGGHRFSGGHVLSLEAVLAGSEEVAALDSLALDGVIADRPEVADLIRIVDRSQAWPAPPLALRRNLGFELRDRLRHAVTHLPNGGGIPGIDRFEAVDDDGYRVLADNWRRLVPHDEIVPADGPDAG